MWWGGGRGEEGGGGRRGEEVRKREKGRRREKGGGCKESRQMYSMCVCVTRKQTKKRKEAGVSLEQGFC